MYLFIAIIFIAELIIAFQIIILILNADKKVCALTECVEVFNPLAKTCLQYTRCLAESFSESFNKIISVLKKKKEQIIYKTILMIAIYIFLLLFKIRKKKISKIYKLIGTIRELATELAI